MWKQSSDSLGVYQHSAELLHEVIWKSQHTVQKSVVVINQTPEFPLHSTDGVISCMKNYLCTQTVELIHSFTPLGPLINNKNRNQTEPINE